MNHVIHKPIMLYPPGFKSTFLCRTSMKESNGGDEKDASVNVTSTGALPPAQQFAPLASTFQRRILIGVGSASVVALGANFVGVTSFVLGFSPETGRNLKLDVIYPIKGFFRYVDASQGIEFVYPASWVQDQTLFYRAVGKAEYERGHNLPPLNDSSKRQRRSVNEPSIAFGPPGTSGELNVSVIISTVPLDFSIESFGSPWDIGEAIVKTIVRSSRRSDITGSLVDSTMRADSSKDVKYFTLEFKVESPSFRRHNIAVCCVNKGKLYTLNAQAPESEWQKVKSDFYNIAESFALTA